MLYTLSLKHLVLLYLLSFLFGSCSYLDILKKAPNPVTKKLQTNVDENYSGHINFWGDQFLAKNRKSILRLSRGSYQYLKSLYKKIYDQNEILMKKGHKPRFYIINDLRPYFFALPDSRYIISKGIVIKYIKNEDLLAALLAYEMTKSLNKIYEKKFFVPNGYIDLEKILSLTSIDYKVRNEIREIAFLALRRSGFEGVAFLRWLQIRNRNALDFAHHRQLNEEVIKEEYALKSFVLKKANVDESISNRNSSKAFYRYIDDLKRK